MSVGLTVIAAMVAFAPVHAHAEGDRAKDEAAIKQLGKDWQDAWNKRDAEAMTSLLEEDIDFVTVLGPNGWLKGREQFRTVHASMFHSLFVDSVWTTKETRVKFLRPDIAIARVLWATEGDTARR